MNLKKLSRIMDSSVPNTVMLRFLIMLGKEDFSKFCALLSELAGDEDPVNFFTKLKEDLTWTDFIKDVIAKYSSQIGYESLEELCTLPDLQGNVRKQQDVLNAYLSDPKGAYDNPDEFNFA